MNPQKELLWGLWVNPEPYHPKVRPPSLKLRRRLLKQNSSNPGAPSSRKPHLENTKTSIWYTPTKPNNDTSQNRNPKALLSPRDLAIFEAVESFRAAAESPATLNLQTSKAEPETPQTSNRRIGCKEIVGVPIERLQDYHY